MQGGSVKVLGSRASWREPPWGESLCGKELGAEWVKGWDVRERSEDEG
jgi:hypothetical protein